MTEGIKNVLFKIHVKRFLWYVGMWAWCWEHGAPIFITRLLVMLIRINAKTARIYKGCSTTYKKRKESSNDQA